MTSFSCPTCGAALQLPRTPADATIRCPHCGAVHEAEPPRAFSSTVLYPEHEAEDRRTRLSTLVVAVALAVGLFLVVGLAFLISAARTKDRAKVAAPGRQSPSRPSEPFTESPTQGDSSKKAPQPVTPQPADPPQRPRDGEPVIPPLTPPREPRLPGDTLPPSEPGAPRQDEKPVPGPDKPPKEEKDVPAKQPKKDDLPNVSLVIPKETPPAVIAIIRREVDNLRSKSFAERAKAAEVLGDLKQEGKPVCGHLCLTMLDSVPAVRVAAADALKKIDGKMQYLAVTLLTMDNWGKRRELYREIQKLEEDGEPLSTLVAYCALRSHVRKPAVYPHVVASVPFLLEDELSVLAHIAKHDWWTCWLMTSALDNSSESVRRSAIHGLARMKYAATAIFPKKGWSQRGLLTLLSKDTTENRIAAIKTLVILANNVPPETKDRISKALHDMRYDNEQTVRRAVEEALNKLRYTAP